VEFVIWNYKTFIISTGNDRNILLHNGNGHLIGFFGQTNGWNLHNFSISFDAKLVPPREELKFTKSVKLNEA
jgi:hypothetical protein